MAAEKESTTNRISKSNVKLVRFITSVFSYLFILTCSCMIIYFSNKRGNPSALKVLYYIALSLNIAQILLIIGQFIVQQLGIFDRLLRRIENILAIVWETVIVAEFIFACVLFEAFRLDSLLIALAQGLAIALMLLYSRKIDYNVNKKYNRRSQKNGEAPLRNPSVIKRRDLSKNILYILACALIFTVELAVLAMPKLPPKIDDIFTENRVLQYTYYNDVSGYSNGYYVSDVYYGTNDKIVIPLTYNDRPVVGILKNAISDVGRINSIQIGEYNSNGVLISNVEIIETNGIKLDRIIEIDLPNSLKRIDAGAVSGNSIKTINLYSSCAIKNSCFRADNLETINLKNNTSTVQADYENFDVEVNVPKELYNQYRENFFADRSVFNIIGDEQYIVVDFETNTNGYLNSQILDKNNPKINITSLKNTGEETSTFIKDTVLYNSNHYISDGFSSKLGYAFRGWFRDANYTLECNFNDSSDVTFNADTTIYARWEEIKTIELDWSKYYPYNETITTIHYVASENMNESITFPKLVADGGDVTRIGFSSLKWKYGDKSVEKTFDLRNSSEKTIRLKAEWELIRPEVSYETKSNNVVYQGSNLSFTFDESQIINYAAAFSHLSSDVSITCNWKKQNGNGGFTTLKNIVTTNNDIFNYSLRNVTDSGVYELEVIAKAKTGETASVTQSYTININKKDIDISSYGIMAPVTRVYNGNNQELNYTYSVPSTIKVSKAYDVKGDSSYSSLVGPINAQNDAYSVRYTFENIGAERENYNVGYSYSTITITPKPVTAIWDQSDISWNSDFEIVYDGQPKNLVPTVNGKCGNDVVEFLLENTSKIEAGGYIQKIIGISNTNYMLDTAHIVISKPWKILQKNISVTWGATEKPYTGSNVTFELNIGGIASRDKNSITLNNFTCVTDCDSQYSAGTCKFIFSAKNIGEYDILVDNFTNTNYSFSPVSKTVKINPATLSTSWSDTVKEYTGDNQTAKLTISGFKLGEEQYYTDTTLNNFFVIQSDCDYSIISKANGSLVIGFKAKNAGSYSLKLEKVISDNYTVATATTNYTISKKELTGSWVNDNLVYKGVEQYRTYRISGLNQNDVSNMTVDDFTTVFDGIKVELDKGSGYVDLKFYVKDAKSYNAKINAVNLVKYNNNFTFSNKVDYSFSVSPKLLSVSWNTSSFTYDDTEKEVTATVTNRCGSDIIDLVYSGNKAHDAGSYKASITTTNSNYTTDSTSDHAWKINKKALTVTIETVDGENNTLSNSIYDGKYKYFKVKYSGFAGNDLTTDISSANFTYSFSNSSYISNAGSVIEGTYFVSKFKAIDAKSYTITLASNTLANYSVTVSKTFTINQLKSEINWGYSTPFVYAKTAYTISPVISNKQTREDTGTVDTVTPTLQGNKYTDAGAYTAKVTSVSNSNYYVDTTANTLNWVIEKRTVTVVWDNPTLVYNASHQQKNASVTNLCSGDNVGFSYNYAVMNSSGVYGTYSSAQTINKGSYKVKATGLTGSSANNYQMPSSVQESTYEIAAKKLTVSIGGSNYTYDGTDKSVITLSISGFPTSSEANNFTTNNINYQTGATLVKESSSSSACSFAFKAKNAGSYEATVSGCKNNSNYIFDACSESHTISPRKISVSWAQSNYTYDGTSKSFTATITNKISGDSVPITYSYSGTSVLGNQITSTSMADAGTYIVNIEKVGNANYTIDGVTNLSNTFTIDRRAISVSYTGTSHTYNGDYQGLTVSVTGFVDKDKSLFTDPTGPLVYTNSGCKNNYNDQTYQLSLCAVNVGTYNVTITGLIPEFDSSNYYLSSTVNTSYTISKATISVNWSNTGLTYNGSTQGVTATINSNTIYQNVLTGVKDIVNVSLTGNSGVVANSYTATLSAIDNENYQLPSTKTKSWTIAKKSLTLDWSPSTRTFTYDGQPHEITLTISGFVDGDTTGLTKSSFTSASGSMSINDYAPDGTSIKLSFNKIDAGTYTYQLNSIADTNYTFSQNKGTLTINKRVASLVWNYSTAFAYDGSSKSVGCSVDNTCIRNDTGIRDTVSVTLSGNTQTNAGTYTAKATALSNANYTLPSSVTKSWTINKVKLTSTWLDCGTFAYNGETRYATLRVSGFVNGEASSMTTSSFSASTYTLDKSTGSVDLKFSYKDAKDYSFVVSSINNSNYELTSTSNNVKVTQKQLTSTWLDCGTFAYNGETRYATLRVSGFVGSDASSLTTSSFSASTYTLDKSTGSVDLKFSYKDAKDYSFVVSSINNSNYVFISTSSQVSVTKPQLSVQWVGSDFIYDGNSHEIKAYISGFVNSEESSVSLSNFTRSFSNGSSSISPTVTTGSGSLILTFSIKDVATYSFSISGYSGNYTVQDKTTNKITVKVSPKTVTVSWSGLDSYTYNGSSQGKTMYISGIASGDISTFKNYLSASGVTPTITTDASGVSYYFGETNKGTYNISVSAKSTLKNYSFSAQSKTFAITAQALETSWSSSTGNWSDTYNGQNSIITLTISGFVNGEKFTSSNFTSSRTISNYDNSVSGVLKLSYNLKDSGNYEINVSAFSGSNYSFVSTKTLYTINKKTLSTSWSGSSSTYSGTSQGYDLVISGIIIGEETTVKNCLSYTNSNITPSITTNNSSIKLSFKKTDAGSYSVVVKGNTSLKNYDLSTQTKNFSISKKTLTVDTNSIGSGILQFNGLVSGESISKSAYTLSIYEDAQRTKLLSLSDLQENTTYYYHIDLIGNSNYSLSNSDGSFEIGEA